MRCITYAMRAIFLRTLMLMLSLRATRHAAFTLAPRSADTATCYATR